MNIFSSVPKRRIAALSAIPAVFSALITALKDMNFSKAAAMLTAVFQLFGAGIADNPVTPYGDTLDMSKFNLVWQDEFDRGFNTEMWQGHYVYGNNDTQKRDVAYWNRDQVSFTDDGCLLITVDYKENGPAGANYYSYGMETNPNKNYAGDHTGYEQLYGYFEIRCILPEGKGMNPAFWLLTDGMWNDNTDGGVSGCEIDVLETNTYANPGSKYYSTVFQTIHIDGYDEAHKSELQGWFYADNPYSQFNTYGVEWNENGYIFYVNGIETARTDFGGVCKVPLYLIISVGVDEHIAENQNLPASFKVDYVRAYQYK